MASRMGTRPTAAEIAEWDLEVIALPVVPGATGWTDYDDVGACEHCGDSPVYPARASGLLCDGDPAVCVWCGLVYGVSCDSETPPCLSDPHAVLREDDHARLYDLLAGEVSDG